MTSYQATMTNFRLSPQQRLCWQSQQPAPSLELEILGDFDQLQWLQTLQTIVTEQEVMRSKLQKQPGLRLPLQGISEQGCVAIISSTKQSLEDDAELAHLDIRADLTPQENNSYRLHLTLPPLSADRGTLLRLAQTLADQTTQTCAQSCLESDDEATSYSHYSAWLYDLQEDEDAEEGKRYWAQQCPEHWQPVGLVYQQQSHGVTGDMVEITSACDEMFVQNLSSFCRQHEVTEETVLITAWASVLRRLSLDYGQDGTMTPLGWVHDCRRDYEELANTWGMFSRPLPLPWQAIAEESFLAAVERMQNQQEAASEWQEYYAIEADAKPEHGRFGFEWGNSLDSTEVVTSGVNTIAQIIANTHSSIRIAGVKAFSQNFDLLLVPELLVPTEEGAKEESLKEGRQGNLVLRLSYDTRCYSDLSARVLLEQYQSFLLAALATPTKPVAELAMESAAFRSRLDKLAHVQPWPTLSNDDLYPAQFSLAAQKHKDLKAIVATDLSLNYRVLETYTNKLAHYLIAQGIGAESKVALYLDQPIDMLVAMLAVMKSGAAFVPLERRQPAARTLTILQDAKPNLLVCRADQSTPSLLDIPRLSLELVGGEFTQEPSLDNYSSQLPQVRIDPKQAAYLLFTSGSTGKPKGVIVCHRQIQNYTSSILSRIPLHAGEKSAIVTSLAADLSYTLLFTTLLKGGELHLIERETTLNPEAWIAYQQRHQVDHLKIVPSLLDAWLSHGDVVGVLPRKQLILGGEACKLSVLESIQEQAPQLQLYNHYGPTETTIGVMIHRIGRTLPTQGLPLSERLDNTMIFLLDNALQPVSAGMLGEVYIAGANLSRGYLSLQQNQDRFIPNPFLVGKEDVRKEDIGGESVGAERLYRTGDLARYLADGSIVLQGRADRQVKIRGYRIELDEIENLLNTLPAVNQSAVVAVPRQQGDLQMFAFVTQPMGQEESLAQIQGQLQDRLPDHMVPTLRLLDSLPLMANGKLNRQVLQQQAADLLQQSGSKLPRTPLEATLAKLWAEVLGLESIGVEDDFFALGGHSLAAIKLTSRLQAALSMSVKVNMIFCAPTVAQFAQLVDNDMDLGCLIPLSASKEEAVKSPQLFCFHPSTGHVEDYRHLPDILPQWQLWGLQCVDMTGEAQDSADSLATMAAQYLVKIRGQQAQGPYYLMGWSLGGLLATTTAKLLEQSGEEVAFLGLIDTRLTIDESAQTVEQLLEWAQEEFDMPSRQYLKQLTSDQRQSLVDLLAHKTPEQWPFTLLNWARQQGLQLENDSWEHAEKRQLRHAYTTQLIRSFNPTQLNCPIAAWWASATLAQTPMPADWQAMTLKQAQVRTISAHHFNILRKDDWLAQLQVALESALLD